MSAVRTDEEWRSIILECRASGIPDKIWCRDHGIAPSTFYYNIRKQRRLACEIPEPQCQNSLVIPQEVVPILVDDETDLSHTRSVPSPLYSMMEVPNAFLTIEGQGISVTCSSDVPDSLICSVIQALQAKC